MLQINRVLVCSRMLLLLFLLFESPRKLLFWNLAFLKMLFRQQCGKNISTENYARLHLDWKRKMFYMLQFCYIRKGAHLVYPFPAAEISTITRIILLIWTFLLNNRWSCFSTNKCKHFFWHLSFMLVFSFQRVDAFPSSFFAIEKYLKRELNRHETLRFPLKIQCLVCGR